MKKGYFLGIVLLCGITLAGCGNANNSKLEEKLDKLEKNITSLNDKVNELEAVDVEQEEKDKKAAEKEEKDKKIAELLKGKIKVPNTDYKSQEQVKAEFEAAGLKVKFVVTNMDEKAKISNKKIYKGECAPLNDNCGAEYFDGNTVGSKLGYYAKKDDTIIVGYTDHEYDGTKKAETAPSSSAEAASPTTPSSSSEAAAEKKAATTSKSDIEAAIKKVDAKYDEMIKKAQGYVDNPSTYDDTAALSFLTDYTELMAEYASLGETIDNSGEELSASDSMTIYTNMLTKYTKLMELYAKL